MIVSNNSYNRKIIYIICILIGDFLIVFWYQSTYFSKTLSQSRFFVKKELKYINQSCNEKLTFERRKYCNSKTKESCYSTNKSLVVSFWGKKSVKKWVSKNILSAFPLHSFDHIIFVHDNSSWHSHPGYQHFIWIHVTGQHRLWYLKRFVVPMISKSYEFIWIIDDDAQLKFNPLQYQCVVNNLSIPLSAPARLTGALSHPLTRMNAKFSNQIGRWTDFIETGPIVVASSLAWQCIYMYIDASTVTGWGIDLIWCNMLAKRCLPSSERKKVCAILDAFGVDHQSTGVSSGKDGAPELPVYAQPHKKWLSRKKIFGPLATDNRLIELCYQ